MDITAKDVVDQWKLDSCIDELAINVEICRTPALHSKYLQYYIHFKDELSKLDAAFYRLGNVKRKYYRGEFTREELAKYGWEQFQGLKPSNVEMQSHLNYDVDMIAFQEKIDNAKTAISSCEIILKNIASRDFGMKTLVDYNKYLSGG
jgi:hypothetical protein